MALYDWDSSNGLKMFDKWSMGCADKYDPDALIAKWEDFSSGSLSGDVTVGKLYYLSGTEPRVMQLFKEEEEGYIAKPSIIKEKKMTPEQLEKEVKELDRQGKSIEYDPMLFPRELREYMMESVDSLGLNFSAAVPYTLMMLSQMLGDRVKVRMTSSWLHVPVIW
jgi:hypothetical protein